MSLNTFSPDTDLLAHFHKYPAIEPTDAVKLLYQRFFGGGHMISDEAASLERLNREWEALVSASESSMSDINTSALSPDTAIPEYIGNGLYRVPLSLLGKGLSPATLNRMFVLSAREISTTASASLFEEALRNLTEGCRTGVYPLSANTLDVYLAEYRAKGCPAVSHSEAYRRAYNPAYRLVTDRFVRLLPMCLEIDRYMTYSSKQDNTPILAAIDGPCGSGKTTLADALGEIYDCTLFRMDEFFLRPEQRTPERFAQPGGNVDYERFKEEVLDPLRTIPALDPDNTRTPCAGSLTYRPFSCAIGALTEPVTVPVGPLVIIEGSYSQHPYFGDSYDLRFCLSVSPTEQLRRLSLRETPEKMKRFREEWIPFEKRYFDEYSIAEKSIVIPND